MVTAVEKFAQLIPLNLQEIFIWYFEQKGVDNPERFLSQGAGVNEGVNGEQLSAGNPAGSEEIINPGINAMQQQGTNITDLQGQPQEQVVSNEPQANSINQGQNPKLDIIIPIKIKL